MIREESNEFGAVTLGDGRLRTRLLTLARDFYARPTASLTECCGGSWAKYRAACRFLDHPRTGLNALLASHYCSAANCGGDVGAGRWLEGMSQRSGEPRINRLDRR